jgi:glutaredoxin
MIRTTVFFTLALLAIPGHADKVYRWRDNSGAVHYSDLAPPPDARDAERKRVGDRPPEQVYPYAVHTAMRSFPVTLYVAEACGGGCTRAAQYLAARGTPYTEVDALDGDNAKALSALTGGRREVPVLVVGKSVLRGYDESAWTQALDAAGYPNAPLPKGMTARRVAPKAAVVEEKLVEAKTDMTPAADAPTPDAEAELTGDE